MHKMAPATGLAPNNSFKPNLLRYTKAMAEKACHGFGSTTQVGLTQALGRRVNCMGKFLSRSVAFRLSLGLLMSFGAAQLRDFLALRFTSHQSLADRIIGLALVLSLGIFVLRPLFLHFGIGQRDLSKGSPKLEIGKAHVCTPFTNAYLVCPTLLDNKN